VPPSPTPPSGAPPDPDPELPEALPAPLLDALPEPLLDAPLEPDELEAPLLVCPPVDPLLVVLELPELPLLEPLPTGFPEVPQRALSEAAATSAATIERWTI
jgi:DNA polymerase-3 subunit gamma/tau